MAAKERRERKEAVRQPIASSPSPLGGERTGVRGVLRTLRPVRLAALLALLAFTAPRASAATQQIALSTGWNLVSVQVGAEGVGFTIAQLIAGMDRSNVLESVWAYDPVQRTYTSYQASTNYPSDLAALKPGFGYWVKVTSDTVLTLSGPVWNGAVNLAPGWNLIGFPGLSRTDTETLTLESVFRDRAAKVPQVWTFQGGSSLVGGQHFVGYDTTAQPRIGELKSIEPGQGYWVYGGEALSLAPAPALVLLADTDLPDSAGKLGTNTTVYLGRQITIAGIEDAATDLNGNGLLDDPYTQSVVLFDEGVNTQNITILNTNSSLLNWSISTSTPWLTFSLTNGTTASESDYVAVSVNRAGLTSGSYTGSFTADFGFTQRVVTVLLRVPTVAGDYRGAATTTRVNGNPVSLGKVDLNFSLFMEGDSPATNRFRGVINRGQALLFPQDVFLDGVIIQGNSFSLTTTFEMPAGDRYEPPYDTATNLFNYNPFPFAIYRQVTLQGTRVTADRLEGIYVESISGVLPSNQRITIEGTFTMDRQTLAPTKRSIYNGKSSTTPIPIGGSASLAYTNTLNVPNAVSIQGAVVTVNTSYPRPDQLTLTLVGPGTNGTHVLVSASSNLASSAVFSLTNFNGRIGQGDWRLVVDWNGSSERGQFNGWELNLLGLATYSATGTLVSTNGGVADPVAGATLTLAGGNIIFQAVTLQNGEFSFPSLTENLYTLNLSKLGYQDASVFFRITRSNAVLGNLVLQPIASTETNLLAKPSVGAAPLNVTFSPQIPLAALNSLGANITSTWTFGDGGTLVQTNLASSVEHTYTNGIHITNAVLVLTGSGGTLSLTNSDIHVTAIGPNTNIAPHQVGVSFGPRTNFIFGGAFIGSMAAPVQNLAVDVQSQTTSNATTGYFHQESKRDVVAFDFDRFPFSTNAFAPTAEDTAFFVQPGTPYVVIATTPAPPGNPFFTTYSQPTGAGGVPKPDRFRIICTLGGTVFGPQPASSGSFILQTGRIEP